MGGEGKGAATCLQAPPMTRWLPHAGGKEEFMDVNNKPAKKQDDVQLARFLQAGRQVSRYFRNLEGSAK